MLSLVIGIGWGAQWGRCILCFSSWVIVHSLQQASLPTSSFSFSSKVASIWLKDRRLSCLGISASILLKRGIRIRSLGGITINRNVGFELFYDPQSCQIRRQIKRVPKYQSPLKNYRHCLPWHTSSFFHFVAVFLAIPHSTLSDIATNLVYRKKKWKRRNHCAR